MLSESICEWLKKKEKKKKALLLDATLTVSDTKGLCYGLFQLSETYYQTNFKNESFAHPNLKADFVCGLSQNRNPSVLYIYDNIRLCVAPS